MGGMISLELASIAPERIKSLSLIVTSPGFLQGPFPGKSQFASMFSIVGGFFKTSPESMSRSFMHLMYPDEFLDSKLEEDNTLTVRDILHKYLLKSFKIRRSSAKGDFGQHAAVLSHNVNHARLVEIRDAGFPILIIGGKMDRLLHPGNSEYLASALSSSHTRIAWYENAGHGVCLQCTNGVTDDLVSTIFFASN